MATGSVLLPIAAATLPDGTANNLAPAIQRVKSSAGAPAPFFLQAAFDAASQELMHWSFRMPADYASAPVAKIQFKMASATTGNVVVGVRVAAISDGDATDVDAKALAASNDSGAVAVPATAGFLKEVSIALATNDSLAAGDYVTIMFKRTAADVNDTATGDLELIAFTLQYTTV